MKTSPMVLGPNRMKNLSEYAKTAEAAQILGVAQNTLRKWAEQGDIPVHRNPANGYRLFNREDLMRFLKKIDQSSKSGS
jgi:excisionase family DNA binding protein